MKPAQSPKRKSDITREMRSRANPSLSCRPRACMLTQQFCSPVSGWLDRDTCLVGRDLPSPDSVVPPVSRHDERRAFREEKLDEDNFIRCRHRTHGGTNTPRASAISSTSFSSSFQEL